MTSSEERAERLAAYRLQKRHRQLSVEAATYWFFFGEPLVVIILGIFAPARIWPPEDSRWVDTWWGMVLFAVLAIYTFPFARGALRQRELVREELAQLAALPRGPAWLTAVPAALIGAATAIVAALIGQD